MDRVDSLIDQMARLAAQNRLELDPDLRRENEITIKSLHERVRNPWHGLMRNVVLLLLVFFAAIVGLLELKKCFGLGSVTLASTVVAIVMVIVICTILLVTGHINQDTFKNLVDTCLRRLPSSIQSEKGEPARGTKLGPIASKTIIAESDPMLPAPKNDPPE